MLGLGINSLMWNEYLFPLFYAFVLIVSFSKQCSVRFLPLVFNILTHWVIRMPCHFFSGSFVKWIESLFFACFGNQLFWSILCQKLIFEFQFRFLLGKNLRLSIHFHKLLCKLTCLAPFAKMGTNPFRLTMLPSLRQASASHCTVKEAKLIIITYCFAVCTTIPATK